METHTAKKEESTPDPSHPPPRPVVHTKVIAHMCIQDDAITSIRLRPRFPPPLTRARDRGAAALQMK
jgi:hypothetical protein